MVILPKNQICLFFTEKVAHLTRAYIKGIDNCFWKAAKSLFFCRQSIPEIIVFGQHALPWSLIILLSDRQLGMNVLHIVTAPKYLTFVCNVILVLADLVNFPRFKVHNFCKKNWLPSFSMFLMEKMQKFLF